MQTSARAILRGRLPFSVKKLKNLRGGCIRACNKAAPGGYRCTASGAAVIGEESDPGHAASARGFVDGIDTGGIRRGDDHAVPVHDVDVSADRPPVFLNDSPGVFL